MNMSIGMLLDQAARTMVQRKRDRQFLQSLPREPSQHLAAVLQTIIGREELRQSREGILCKTLEDTFTRNSFQLGVFIRSQYWLPMTNKKASTDVTWTPMFDQTVSAEIKQTMGQFEEYITAIRDTVLNVQALMDWQQAEHDALLHEWNRCVSLFDENKADAGGSLSSSAAAGATGENSSVAAELSNSLNRVETCHADNVPKELSRTTDECRMQRLRPTIRDVIRIQSVWRGYRTRKRWKPVLEDSKVFLEWRAQVKKQQPRKQEEAALLQPQIEFTQATYQLLQQKQQIKEAFRLRMEQFEDYARQNILSVRQLPKHLCIHKVPDPVNPKQSMQVYLDVKTGQWTSKHPKHVEYAQAKQEFEEQEKQVMESKLQQLDEILGRIEQLAASTWKQGVKQFTREPAT